LLRKRSEFKDKKLVLDNNFVKPKFIIHTS